MTRLPARSARLLFANPRGHRAYRREDFGVDGLPLAYQLFQAFDVNFQRAHLLSRLTDVDGRMAEALPRPGEHVGIGLGRSLVAAERWRRLEQEVASPLPFRKFGEQANDVPAMLGVDCDVEHQQIRDAPGRLVGGILEDGLVLEEFSQVGGLLEVVPKDRFVVSIGLQREEPIADVLVLDAEDGIGDERFRRVARGASIEGIGDCRRQLDGIARVTGLLWKLRAFTNLRPRNEAEGGIRAASELDGREDVAHHQFVTELAGFGSMLRDDVTAFAKDAFAQRPQLVHRGHIAGVDRLPLLFWAPQVVPFVVQGAETLGERNVVTPDEGVDVLCSEIAIAIEEQEDVDVPLRQMQGQP